MSDTRPTPPRKESKAKKLAAYLKLAADVGGILMDLRDRPSRMDWFSMGMRSANIGINWYTDRQRVSKIPSPWDFFNENNSGWASFPREYNKIIIQNAQDLRVAEQYLNADIKMPYACLGRIGTEIVGWCVEGGQITDGPYYKEERETETFAALGVMLWRTLGAKHLLYTPGGLVIDSYNDEGVIPTKQMTWLLDRIKKFLVAKEPRGYMLSGVPGTGKSIAIRWLANTMGLSSIRVDLRLLEANGEVAASLETMLRALAPDVMILDDLDRIEVSAQVLSFLETARQSCRVVMASANSVDALQGATLRPGRFDDIITFDKLDFDVIARMLGTDSDLAGKVQDLPAAYVAEFARRCKVLGRDQALKDLPELKTRAEATSEDSDD